MQGSGHSNRFYGVHLKLRESLLTFTIAVVLSAGASLGWAQGTTPGTGTGVAGGAGSGSNAGQALGSGYEAGSGPISLGSTDQDLPELGSPANAAVSLEDEYQAGLGWFREMGKTGTVLEDPEVSDYIQQIGHSQIGRAHV